MITDLQEGNRPPSELVVAHALRTSLPEFPHSRRWGVSLSGRRIMAAALKLREVAYPSLYAEAA
ncbi:MAG: hypothetical protein ACREQ9_00685 [Candidatus Binatia bacterium]